MDNTNRQQIQASFNWLHPTVTNIICRYDPLYILAMGGAEHAYDSEVSDILHSLALANDQTAVRTIVHAAFAHHFNDNTPPLDDPRYEAIAGEIWQAYQRWYPEQQEAEQRK